MVICAGITILYVTTPKSTTIIKIFKNPVNLWNKTFLLKFTLITYGTREYWNARSCFSYTWNTWIMPPSTKSQSDIWQAPQRGRERGILRGPAETGDTRARAHNVEAAAPRGQRVRCSILPGDERRQDAAGGFQRRGYREIGMPNGRDGPGLLISIDPPRPATFHVRSPPALCISCLDVYLNRRGGISWNFDAPEFYPRSAPISFPESGLFRAGAKLQLPLILHAAATLCASFLSRLISGLLEISLNSLIDASCISGFFFLF